MTGVDSYSTTAATNATATGGSVNYSEGQAPSTVNNSARQVLADIRSFANDLIWFPYGTGDQGAGNIAVPCVYASATSVTVAGVNVTAVFHANRRVRAVGSSTGTIYGSISSSSFSTNTTINVTWDSGSLSNETLVVSLSQAPVTGKPVHISGVSGGAPTASPTLVTPILGVASATSINKVAITAPATSATLTITDGATLSYEEGTWTPIDSSGEGLTFTSVSGSYTKIGRMVFAYAVLTFPASGTTTNTLIGGLPYAAANASYRFNGRGFSTSSVGGSSLYPVTLANTTTFNIHTAVGGIQRNTDNASRVFAVNVFYPTS